MTSHPSLRWAALALLTLSAPAACIFNAEDTTTRPTPRLTKAEAQARMEADPNAPDYCFSSNWYGDGVCDTFCRQPDSADCPATACSAQSPCPSDQFCDAPLGLCDGSGQGTCKPKPSACTEEYAPVCGCDGKTYSNTCAAQSAAALISIVGECASPPAECMRGECGPDRLAPQVLCPDGVNFSGPSGRCVRGEDGACGWEFLECPDLMVCGGIQGVPCPDGTQCVLPDAMCQTSDLQGVCKAKPAGCTDEYDPVCGCDGKTYSNRCEAEQAQVAVDAPGECKPQVKSCTLRDLVACGRGEFCQFDLDAMCGASDLPGVCTSIPQVCTKELNPVCGCDGKTYDNPCFAQSAGVSVQSKGACKPEPTACSTRDPQPVCGRGQFCLYPDDTCDQRERFGACESSIISCEDEARAPVCGCDGKTYQNRCLATQAGVSVRSTGSCRTIGL